MRLGWLGCLAFLALGGGPAAAGTVEEPEVSDPSGDVRTYVAGAPDLPFRDQVDIVSFWVARADPYRLDLHLRLLSLDPIDKPAPESTDVPPALRWDVQFESPRGGYGITVEYRDEGWTYEMRDWEGHWGDIYGRTDRAMDEIVLNIPSLNMTDRLVPLNLTKFELRAQGYRPFSYSDTADGGDAYYLEPLDEATPAPRPPQHPDGSSPGLLAPGVALGTLAAFLVHRRRARGLT